MSPSPTLSHRIFEMRLLLVTGGVVLAIAGVLVGVFLTTSPSGTGAERETVVPVEVRPFADERQVTLSLDVAAPAPAVVRAGGTVTALTCIPGAMWTSGSQPLSVDGVSILALHTSTPIYRDVSVGMTGADAAAIQAELVRLGVVDAGDGKLRKGDLRALWTLAGTTDWRWTMPLTRLMWLPKAEVRIAECQVFLGSAVTGVVATFEPSIQRIRVAPVGEQLVPGPRQVVVGDVVVPLDDQLSNTDPEVLAALADLPEVQVNLESDGAVEVGGSLQLAEPPDAARVPPSAVVDGSCVFSNGEAIPVEVISSSLGSSVVTFAGPPPATVDVLPAGVACE